ncbi:hypothetical protein OQA88_9800 [Cercophora sp. LCS_1]
MAKFLTVKVDGPGIVVDAVLLTREGFAPFGDVIDNPRPDLHPSQAATTGGPLPHDGIVANQGSAIKYQDVTRMVNLYDQAPSARPGVAVMNMFVCAARSLIPSPSGDFFAVRVLERHPYTTQTFIPLSVDPRKRFLVIVAPTLPPSPADEHLPVPSSPSETQVLSGRALPGRGLPDLRRLRAFLATSEQAVTYGAGTWHAPMVAVGQAGTALDFVVTQFANAVGVEDCQEVFLEGQPDLSQDWRPERGVVVKVSRPGSTLAKL